MGKGLGRKNQLAPIVPTLHYIIKGGVDEIFAKTISPRPKA
jgi:hypothetical protein